MTRDSKIGLRKTVSIVSGFWSDHIENSQPITDEEMNTQQKKDWIQFVSFHYPEDSQKQDAIEYEKANQSRGVLPSKIVGSKASKEEKEKALSLQKKELLADLDNYMNYLANGKHGKQKTGFARLIQNVFRGFLKNMINKLLWVNQKTLSNTIHEFANVLSSVVLKNWPITKGYQSKAHEREISIVIFNELILHHETQFHQLIFEPNHEARKKKFQVLVNYFSKGHRRKYPTREFLELFPMTTPSYSGMNLVPAIKCLQQMSESKQGFRVSFYEKRTILLRTLSFIVEKLVAFHLPDVDDINHMAVNLIDVQTIVLCVFVMANIDGLIDTISLINFLILKHAEYKVMIFFLELAMGAVDILDDLEEVSFCDEGGHTTTLPSSPIPLQNKPELKRQPSSKLADRINFFSSSKKKKKPANPSTPPKEIKKSNKNTNNSPSLLKSNVDHEQSTTIQRPKKIPSQQPEPISRPPPSLPVSQEPKRFTAPSSKPSLPPRSKLPSSPPPLKPPPSQGSISSRHRSVADLRKRFEK